MRKRNQRTPFLLTETERRILAMLRKGMKYREIALEMGFKNVNSASNLASAAISKERSQARDNRGSEGHTSLSVARGNVRMEGTR